MTIKAPDDITGLWQLWQQAFGDTDEFLELFFTKGYAPERCRCIYDGDRPVAMLYWFNCRHRNRKLAYLYAVATDKDYRQQGLCRILMEDTHRLLEQQGYAGCVLVPGEPRLFDYYRRLGYETAGSIAEYTCCAGVPVSLEKINACRYAALRAGYLPENGVVQEGAALQVLNGYNAFYAGDSFVLAAHQEKGMLTVCELLGEGDGPGIVAALGCDRGTFRTPGQGRPFVMAHWFDREMDSALYFGLALD